MKQLLKKLKVLPFALMGMMYSSKVFAAVDPSQFTGTETNTSGITNIGNQIITILSTGGSIILIILGLKYMMGSAEEKAEYKKTLMPYVIGAGLVFAASAIAGIVFSFTQGLSGEK